ncbi:MAG: type IV secretion system DNA-binding domain-containing protein [Thermoplasmata archaeon]|nr:type IV secretion system DNA-binding domain-containing protein [Thermoplasmata archaeon]MCI4353736.1 type IV secretion system DNA-binding domain-containing protein [Thermoplasmata archaeon]
MERPIGRSTYFFLAEAPIWTRSFLRRVAESLARAPPPHTLLVERASGDRFPRLTPSDPELDATVRAAAAGVPGRLLRRARSAGEPLVLGRSTRVGFLTAPPQRTALDPDAPDPRPRDDPAAPEGSAEPLGSIVGDGTSAHVQSHWFPDPSGRLRVWTRFVAARPADADGGRLLAAGLALARRVDEVEAVRPQVRIGRPPIGAAAEWESGRLYRLRCGPPLCLSATGAAALLSGEGPASGRSADLSRHTVVLGSTGSGKTGLVAAMAADRIGRGTPVVLFDVHGDLAPAVVARVPPRERARLLAIDASAPPERIPGFSVLEAGEAGGTEAAAADVVAALKRLSSEGGEVYWGFRLERIFDTFVRVVQDEGGSLLDLVDLLTDERRRESARLTTRRPHAARFLGELPAVVRRSPEFLWPAASRISKIALVPALAALLAPSDGGIPFAKWVGNGGSVLWRIPFADLGPEGARLAGTLLATRAYLALARSPGRSGKRLRALFVFDEAHAFSARLLAELLAEGRKFGIGVVLATQFPERLDPELRAAAAGAVGTHVIFRVPSPSARVAGAWAGLSPETASTVLPALPVGHAVRSTGGGAPSYLVGSPLPTAPRASWDAAVASTSLEFTSGERGWDRAEGDRIGEAILLELVGAEARGEPMGEAELLRAFGAGAVDPIDPESLRRSLGRGIALEWVARDGRGLRLTEVGAHRLGIGAATGATTESAEHRALLVEALRIFARHRLRLEILRQGRFDTRLPDAVLRIVAPIGPDTSPADAWKALEGRRSSWAWRFFGGRHVHVEAEVSGAERRERIRRGLDKAARRGAFALFVVADARKARRVRSVLADAELFPHSAQVWTLPKARSLDGPPQALPSPEGSA